MCIKNWRNVSIGVLKTATASWASKPMGCTHAVSYKQQTVCTVHLHDALSAAPRTCEWSGKFMLIWSLSASCSHCMCKARRGWSHGSFAVLTLGNQSDKSPCHMATQGVRQLRHCLHGGTDRGLPPYSTAICTVNSENVINIKIRSHRKLHIRQMCSLREWYVRVAWGVRWNSQVVDLGNAHCFWSKLRCVCHGYCHQRTWWWWW